MRLRRRLVVLAATILALEFIGTADALSRPTPLGDRSSDVTTPGSPSIGHSFPSGRTQVPDELAAAMSRLRYDAAPDAAGRLVAKNPSHGLNIRYTSQGVRVRTKDTRLVMSFRRWGRDGALRQLVPTLPTIHQSSVLFIRDGISEWYRNDHHGLEQGFTLHKRPRGTGDVVLEVGLRTNDESPLRRSADAIWIGESMRYHSLTVWDASKKPLPARMELDRGLVRLVVEDRTATYPVTIDPVIDAGYGATLLHPGSVNCCAFSRRVAISGDTAVVGAPTDGDEGAAYVFVRSGSKWTHQQTLRAPQAENPVTRQVSLFGFDVDIAENVIVVGGPETFTQFSLQSRFWGAAWVFTRNGSTWSVPPGGGLLAELDVHDHDPRPKGPGHAWDDFGASVAVSRTAPPGYARQVIVGAPGVDPVAIGSGFGAAYIFSAGRNANLLARLKNPGGATEFGSSVDIFSGVAIVGSPSSGGGRAQIFKQDGAGSWVHRAALVPPQSESFDEFGRAVAIDMTRRFELPFGGFSTDYKAIVGAPTDSVFVDEPGSAHVFSSSNGVEWSRDASLSAPNPVEGDLFGRTVALQGDTVVAASGGEPGFHLHGFTKQGASWAFRRSFPAPPTPQFCGRVSDVDISGELLIVGTRGTFNDDCFDAAHIYGHRSLIESDIYVSASSSGLIDTRLPGTPIELNTNPLTAVPCNQVPEVVPCTAVDIKTQNVIPPSPPPLPKFL